MIWLALALVYLVAGFEAFCGWLLVVRCERCRSDLTVTLRGVFNPERWLSSEPTWFCRACGHEWTRGAA